MLEMQSFTSWFWKYKLSLNYFCVCGSGVVAGREVGIAEFNYF